ncbi:hypothetical protein Bbelb_041520 [Branchiostoma belcheri]|nr:hypothetical protein Bbelb_041520 [Branchiostoma belcheri]
MSKVLIGSDCFGDVPGYLTPGSWRMRVERPGPQVNTGDDTAGFVAVVVLKICTGTPSIPPDWGGDRALPASAMVPKGEHQGIPYLTGPATDARGSNSNLSDMSSISGNSKYTYILHVHT